MEKIFFKKWLAEQSKLIQTAIDFGLDVDFRDSKYLIDLCFAYIEWPVQAYWKEVFDKVIEMSGKYAPDKKTINNIKQWTNRYFERAIKDGLIRKTSSKDDGRVAIFEWTSKGHELMSKIFASKSR